MKSKRRQHKKGFTLIELIVVIAILAIIAALALPSFNTLKEQSELQVVAANMDTIERAIIIAGAMVEMDASAPNPSYPVSISSNKEGNTAYSRRLKAELNTIFGSDLHYSVTLGSDGIFYTVYNAGKWDYSRYTGEAITKKQHF